MPPDSLPTPALNEDILLLLDEMHGFEASGSVPNTGTGARREGEKFEHLVEEMWTAFSHLCRDGGADSEVISGSVKRQYVKHSVGDRTVFIPAPPAEKPNTPGASIPRWLEVTFLVSDLIGAYPSEAEAIDRYAPESGEYGQERYPKQFEKLSTKFDDTVVLVEGGILHEKILLEYKTAKSTKGRQIDGNAHERLSFQIMQYLEAATRYTRCSFSVVTNGAFAIYRNKYHVNFHVQADRLRNFAWFSMEHACTVPEYRRLVEGILGWLFEGKNRSQSDSK